jgi:hypothetical protein
MSSKMIDLVEVEKKVEELQAEISEGLQIIGWLWAEACSAMSTDRDTFNESIETFLAEPFPDMLERAKEAIRDSK